MEEVGEGSSGKPAESKFWTYAYIIKNKSLILQGGEVGEG